MPVPYASAGLSPVLMQVKCMLSAYNFLSLRTETEQREKMLMHETAKL
jgi:hypothetical protein